MANGKKIRLALWVVIGVLLAGSLLWILRPAPEPQERVLAIVSVGAEPILTIDLAQAEDQEFSILEETGIPITFQVQDHAIRFLESNCPDKVCVYTGFLKNDLDVACCLPNQTMVHINVEENSSGR